MMKGRIALRVRRAAIALTMIGLTVPSFGVEREYVDRARLTGKELTIEQVFQAIP